MTTVRRTGIVLGILLLSTIVAARTVTARTSQSFQHVASPEEVVRQFYDWYLHAGVPSPERKNLVTFRKYVTQRLLKKQMDPDAWRHAEMRGRRVED